MRDLFAETFTYVDTATGNLKPLNNAQVEVRLAGTTTKATIYAARDPANTTQLANPFVTGATGAAEFWAVAGEYDVVVTDQNAPARVAAKTYGWNSAPMGAGAIPGAKIAADGGVPYNALDAVSKRQDIPIGGVIEWWRPASTVPVPTGFVICDGSSVAAADHEFPGISTAINVPDLRNVFTLGASTSKTDGTAATASGDAATDAPGIGGTGGSNFRNLQHTHDMGNHTHTIAHTHTFAHTHTLPHTHTIAHTHDLSNHTHTIAHTHDLSNHTHTLSAHVHSMQGHTHNMQHRHQHDHYHYFGGVDHLHGFSGTTAVRNTGYAGDVGPVATGSGATYFANRDHRHDFSGTTGAADRGLGGNTGGPSTWETGGPINTGDTNAKNDTGGPNYANTGAPSPDATGAPSPNATGASSAASSGAPSVNATGASSAASSGAASTDVTATQSTSTTSAESAANSGVPSTNTTGNGLTTNQDIRPKYVGMLRIMKVKRN